MDGCAALNLGLTADPQRDARQKLSLSPYFACKMGGRPSEARGRGAERQKKVRRT